MTKKDYIRIADAIAAAYKLANTEERHHGVTDVRILLESALIAENPKFDNVRFREYIASKL